MIDHRYIKPLAYPEVKIRYGVLTSDILVVIQQDAFNWSAYIVVADGYDRHEHAVDEWVRIGRKLFTKDAERIVPPKVLERFRRIGLSYRR